jgi:hypothetical protein
MGMDQTTPAGASDAGASPADLARDPDGSAKDPSPPPVPWLRATAADLVDLDFEAPIADSRSPVGDELSDLYRRAAIPAQSGIEAYETPATRVFALLADVTGMHLQAHAREEPFGPFAIWDGRRSAIPSDFRGGPVALLVEMAGRAANPVLRARLADVCWLLERRRGALGAAAIGAYVDTIEAVERGELKFAFAQNDGALEFGARDLLRRALAIGWSIGWDKAEVVRAREAVVRLRGQAVAVRAAAPLIWLAELDLDFGISSPVVVAAGIEEVLGAGAVEFHAWISLWRLAARAYHVAKRQADKHRCQAAAAEAMAAEAERLLAVGGHAATMLASHEVSHAIAELHGVPAMRARRTELRHRLIDIQARIPEEMSVYAHEWDAKPLAEEIEARLGEAPLLDLLFIFAAIGKSPDPADLTAEALENMRQHPLMSLFPGVHYDKDGKVVHRSEAAGQDGDPGRSALRREIAQNESIRRNLMGTAVEFARRGIMARYYLPEDVLPSILRHSPFVPAELVFTFGRGFQRFFQGDLTSALYILTPLLENSLRHVLKSLGHDVTVFDDATQTQKDRTISQLFEQMRDELDAVFTKPITTDIESVFLIRPGPHLRHDLAHGLLHDEAPYSPDAVYACWLIFRLCLLPLLPYRDQLRGALHNAGLGPPDSLE